jgi:hypothetical protein
MLGTSSINQNFDYNAEQSNVGGSNAYLNNAMGNMNQTAGDIGNTANSLLSQAGQTFTTGQSFLNPNSDYYKQQRGFLNEDISQGINESTRNMNMSLASRGVGGGGIRSMLGAANASQIGEQVRGGVNDLFKQGQGIGTQLMGMGMQGTEGAGNLYGQQGNLYGQTGQLGSGIQNRLLEQGMFNAGAQNEATQYGMTSNYNQQMGNQQRKADFWNNALNTVGSIVGGGLAGRNSGGG